jgi:integrase
MRKGELLGLRKSDGRPPGRLLTVRRSRDRDTTKGGQSDVIPIDGELLPLLREACELSPSARSRNGEEVKVARAKPEQPRPLERARDTGFEPVAFGSGELKLDVQGVSTGAIPSDWLERNVAN